MEFNKSQLVQVFSIKISVRISAPYGRKVENKSIFEQTQMADCKLREALNRRFITIEDFNSKCMFFYVIILCIRDVYNQKNRSTSFIIPHHI